MTAITEIRPCQFNSNSGYNTLVETNIGDGRYKGFRIVTLSLGETRGSGGFSEDSWSNMTPQQARDLARALIDAADKAERENQ